MKDVYTIIGGGKGTGPKSHIFDFPNGTLIWRKFAKLRMQLFPYIYTQAHISHDVSKSVCIRTYINQYTVYIGRMDGWMDGWMVGWMDGRMDGRMDGCMDY